MKTSSNIISKSILYTSYFFYVNGLCNIMNYLNILTGSKYIYYISSYMILEKKEALLFSISHDIFLNLYRETDLIICNLYMILYLTYIYSLIQKKTLLQVYISTINIGNVVIKNITHFFIPYPQRYIINIYDKKHLSNIESWVNNQIDNKSNKLTKHWWYSSLKVSQKDSFNIIRRRLLKAFKQKLDNLCVESIEDMDEIYVSANTRIENSSDTVFYNKHIDGPYYLFPFCSVYRCIYAVNKNINIETYIDRTNEKFTLSRGDCLIFDFNKEIHYIKKNIQRRISFDTDTTHSESDTNSDTESDTSSEGNEDMHRITLKIHYITYPKYFKYFAMILKYLNIQYNKNARKLFLYTISPKSLYEKIIAKQILYVTKTTYLIEKHISFQTLFILFCWILIIGRV